MPTDPEATPKPMPDPVHHVAVIGGGTIGASWAAYFLSRGLTVSLVEPNLAADLVRQSVAKMGPALTQLGAPAAIDPSRLHILEQVDGQLAQVDFVQECISERLALKQALLAELEPHLNPRTVIASSTSALLASDIQAGCHHPARVLVGHPFNPPHLLPLVEVVAGVQTAPEAVAQAMAFYQAIGKQPVLVKKEMIGHIANRLTAALFREAVHLIAEGVADVADLETVMTQGPGLRWALMGPGLTYHLAGGTGGIQHYLAHLGPTQEARWRELGDPSLTPEVQKQIIDGVLAMVQEMEMAEWVQRRDQGLVALLNLRKDTG